MLTDRTVCSLRYVAQLVGSEMPAAVTVVTWRKLRRPPAQIDNHQCTRELGITHELTRAAYCNQPMQADI